MEVEPSDHYNVKSKTQNELINKKPLSIRAISELVDKYDHYIFDMDGVIWNGGDIIEGSITTIKQLIKLGKNVCFLSNNNSTTRISLLKKLIKNGITELDEEKDLKKILNSSYILADYIHRNFPEIKKIYLVGSLGLEEELRKLNFDIYGGHSDSNKKLKAHDLDSFAIDEALDACVCGFDEDINFYKISYATQVIFQTKNFFGTNKDLRHRKNDRIYPATYSFIGLLEQVTDIKATIVTKPDPRSLDIIMENNSIPFSEKNKILMIGDNLYTDIEFANNSGIDSLLVFSGVTNEKDFMRIIDQPYTESQLNSKSEGDANKKTNRNFNHNEVNSIIGNKICFEKHLPTYCMKAIDF